MTTTHRLRGAISGFVAGLGFGLLAWLFGVVETDSAAIVVLPILFLLIGLALGWTTPITREVRPKD